MSISMATKGVITSEKVGSSGLTVQEVANAVWDEKTCDHTEEGTFGKIVGWIKDHTHKLSFVDDRTCR